MQPKPSLSFFESIATSQFDLYVPVGGDCQCISPEGTRKSSGPRTTRIVSIGENIHHGQHLGGSFPCNKHCAQQIIL
jgi:hypothetical protein